MDFFANAQDSPISLQGKFHDLLENPDKFTPRYIYEESKTAEDHIKVFKEICNRKQVQHEDVVVRLFPYTFGKMSFQWYLNMPPACITDWASFESRFLDQFKAFIDLAVAYNQFVAIKRGPQKIISRYNHRFHMAYQKMESPYTLLLPTTIQIYFNSMDQLMAILLRRLPPMDIDTLEKVFQEAVTFTKQANPNGGGSMKVPLPANVRNIS